MRLGASNEKVRDVDPGAVPRHVVRPCRGDLPRRRGEGIDLRLSRLQGSGVSFHVRALQSQGARSPPSTPPPSRPNGPGSWPSPPRKEALVYQIQSCEPSSSPPAAAKSHIQNCHATGMKLEATHRAKKGISSRQLHQTFRDSTATTLRTSTEHFNISLVTITRHRRVACSHYAPSLGWTEKWLM